MTHYAQLRSETSQNYLNWRDWPRALDVSELLSAPNGGGFYRGNVLAGSTYARGERVVVEKNEGFLSRFLSVQRILEALIVGETVTIPAIASTAVAEPAWLVNLRNPLLSKDTVTLGATVRSIMSSINPDTRVEIGAQLASVDVSKAAPSHLLAVLTSLFTWREELPEWKVLRDKAYEHYSEKQLKGVDRAFKGLM